MVRILERQYLFLCSDTGYQLFKCRIAQNLGLYMFKGSAMCKWWGWPKFNKLKIFCLWGHGNGSLKPGNTQNLRNFGQVRGFRGYMAK